ncbi:FK506-binding protein [Coleophoma cylindrospora]|uniref:peptidylprolyl isomerase n=1 Tax=Coleophoma cylindrospora TaxID=1849047 RepID=A0A3D8SFH5_9HELO|nr:FK506-binding protein [Coleophoma cylindrospora]
MPLLPVALYGLQVPPGDVLIPAHPDFPAALRITMAAIDPSEPAAEDENSTATTRPRATLKIIRQPLSADDEDDEDDEENEAYMRALLAESSSDEESDEEEEGNAGPSDPAKSKKARKQAALEQLMASIKDDEESDEEMEDADVKKTKKGKGKATDEDEEEDDDEEDSDEDDEDFEIEEFVVCTLDPEQHYQQTLDITIGERERVFFKVTGTHDVFLTGNYVQEDDGGHNHHHEVYDSDDDEDDEDYDLSPDEDELEMELDGDESDELDGLEDPRITEVESDEETAPKLVSKKEEKKGKKRSADALEEPASLDDLLAKAKTEEEPKLSKKQQKKLKKNNGEAVPAKGEEKKEESKDGSAKKVQFSKNLEIGPTGSAEKKKEAAAPAKDNKKGALGVKVINGVKIDDKKLGSGPAAKSGDRVGMRYIGKLVDGKVFDSNKSGKPFSFKLGKGEVIKGWDIGVAGMTVGGERRLTIPANHAYGSKALPGIPANSTLVFDIKLLEIK